MNKIILTLAMGMLTSFAFPQSYHKLIRPNTFWDNYFATSPFRYLATGRQVSLFLLFQYDPSKLRSNEKFTFPA